MIWPVFCSFGILTSKWKKMKILKFGTYAEECLMIKSSVFKIEGVGNTAPY